MEGISLNVVCSLDIHTTKYASRDVTELCNHTTTREGVEKTCLRTHICSNHSANLQSFALFLLSAYVKLENLVPE